MSVRVFHPSVAPFVQQAARALFEAGQLESLVTTVRDDPSSLRQRAICAASRLLRRDLSGHFRRRRVTEIPTAKVASHPWGELARLAVGALDRDGRITDLVWEFTETGFDRRVSCGLHRGLGAVYGFEFSSLATFRRARSLGIRAIYDVPAPESRFVHQLLAAEMDRLPELRTAYHRHTAQREEERIARRHAEWQTADVIIAASRFTRDSYASAGLSVAQVKVVPYGAPPPADSVTHPSANTPLSLVWAGTFGVRKGAHYLLDAWRKNDFGKHARLHVFGAVALPERCLRPLPSGVELHGSISRAELLQHLRNADALIFPTLCDGFGMVVTEAWSQGLPVITTDRAGAADLVKPRQNGLLIRAGDVDAITEVVQWCLDHRPELGAMRENALATAAAWQWSDYRRLLLSELEKAGALSSP